MAIWSWWRATVICLDLRIENRTFVLLLLLIPLWTFAEFNWSETRFRSLRLGKHNPQTRHALKKGLLPFWVPFPLFLQLPLSSLKNCNVADFTCQKSFEQNQVWPAAKPLCANLCCCCLMLTSRSFRAMHGYLLQLHIPVHACHLAKSDQLSNKWPPAVLLIV